MGALRLFRAVALVLAAGTAGAGAATAIWIVSAYWIPIRHGNVEAVVWPFVVAVLGAVVAVSAWIRRPEPAWLAALALLEISVLAIWTIGFMVAPVALLAGLPAFGTSTEVVLRWWLGLPQDPPLAPVRPGSDGRQ